jgi:hypothetical protein
MSVTIFSVVPKRLIEDAKRIEKHAEDQLEAWIALGQSDKYEKALDQARLLRLAANGKDVYSRRAFLKISGFTVKNLDKTPKENPTMKPASPAQVAARKRFAEMARSGAFKKKATKRKANPLPPVVETILEQMGGNKFMVMTGARPVVHGPHMLTFKLPTNQSKANYLDVIHNPGKDLYTMTFRRVSNRGMDSKNLVEYDDVYADQLQPMFEKVTGMYTTLGTMGRKANPITETVIWGLAPGETRDYMEEIMYGGGQKLTKEQIDKVIAAATAAGYHSFRIGGIDMTQKPDFAGALNIRKKRKTNPMHKYTVLFRGTRNVAGEVTASGPQSAKQKIAEKLELPTLAYLVARKTNPAKKTVSKKISQLRHEGYPQRQAVAVALSEQRAGKVKRNPRPAKPKKYYQVSIMQEGLHKTFMPMALYFTFAEAEDYANYLAKQHKNWTIRVHDTRAM